MEYLVLTIIILFFAFVVYKIVKKEKINTNGTTQTGGGANRNDIDPKTGGIENEIE